MRVYIRLCSEMSGVGGRLATVVVEFVSNLFYEIDFDIIKKNRIVYRRTVLQHQLELHTKSLLSMVEVRHLFLFLSLFCKIII